MMRALERDHGRFMATSGLRKVRGLPGQPHELIVVDAAGLPVFCLTEWYRRRKVAGAQGTRMTYLDMVLPFFGWMTRRGYAWDDPPERVRDRLWEFLTTQLACTARPDRAVEGFSVRTTGASPLGESALAVFLAAVGDFYAIMRDAGFYRFGNPMRSDVLIGVKRERRRLIAHAGAPDHAGIRDVAREDDRQPTAFFRRGARDEWIPRFALESEDVRWRVKEAVSFMIRHAPSRRDKAILLLLRQTGARVHEIVGMTAGGYRAARHPRRAMVVNKGSRGREDKEVFFSATAEALLAAYIRTERAQADPHGRRYLVDLDDRAPLFLTRAGAAYTPDAFRYHWAALRERARRRYRVAFTPPTIRHLYVTEMMLKIKERAAGDATREREIKEGFRRIMGWRGRDTLAGYDHSFSMQAALAEITLLHDELEREATAEDAHVRARAVEVDGAADVGAGAPAIDGGDGGYDDAWIFGDGS